MCQRYYSRKYNKETFEKNQKLVRLGLKYMLNAFKIVIYVCE